MSNRTSSDGLTGLDLPAVTRRLADVLDDPAWLGASARLITGGKSNLTFRIWHDGDGTGAADPATGGASVVLRRPPTGPLLPKAHDMAREARVQRGLAGTAVPVARVLHEEPSEEVNGAPFYVMEDVPGVVIRDALPPGYAQTPGEREQLAWALIDTLATLHTVDLPAAGLSDYGRAEGFMERQVGRWTKQWELAKEHDVAEMDELARRLNADVPRPQRTAIVHGDYRLDNCIVDAADPSRVRAVLDWELSTLGDPLADLGMSLMYWSAPGSPMAAVVPTVTTEPGFPGREQLVEHYASASGLDLGRLAFYEAFARLKFAAIVQGVSMRAKGGQMGDQEFADHGDIVGLLATEGLAVLDGD